MTVPVMMIVALAVGLAIGALAGLKWSPAVAQARQLREELERLRQEHDGYRASVNAHFRKTADLVGEMTKSYAAVYDHLAGGARRFCDGDAGDGELAFSPLPGSLAAPVIETNPEPEAPIAAAVAEAAAEDEPAEHADAAAADDDAASDPFAATTAADSVQDSDPADPASAEPFAETQEVETPRNV